MLDLSEWLTRYRHEFLETPGHVASIELALTSPDIQVRFDAQQLHQILTNLVMNGLRYSRKQDGIPHIRLEAGYQAINDLPYLDVIDDGPGVALPHIDHLFEPFYTTESTGTGLGLYLSRELCEANQARLDYIPGNPGACFRISFAHPDRLS